MATPLQDAEAKLKSDEDLLSAALEKSYQIAVEYRRLNEESSRALGKYGADSPEYAAASAQTQSALNSKIAANDEANRLQEVVTMDQATVDQLKKKAEDEANPPLLQKETNRLESTPTPSNVPNNIRPASVSDGKDSEQSQIQIANATHAQSNSNIIDYTPVPNLLHDYASYTYNLSLHAIPIEEYSELVKANKTGGTKYQATNVLIASAGRKDVASSFIRNEEFSEDFYFDNLKMTTTSGETSHSRMTNAINVSFTIIEPYGVTLMNRLIVVSNNLGCSNYAELPYMLQIDFFGYSDSGSNAGTPTKIPGITKYIPIKILAMKIKVGTKGAEYEITASPFNHQAYSDTVVSVPAQFEITTSTVADFFNSDGIDGANYSQTITDYNESKAATTKISRIEDEKKKYIDQSIKNDPDVRTTQDFKNNVDYYDQQISQNKKVAEKGKSVNANSFTAAYNAWFKDLYNSKKQKSFDSISFVIDGEIAKATVTPPEIQPSAQNVMTPTSSNAPDTTAPVESANAVSESANEFYTGEGVSIPSDPLPPEDKSKKAQAERRLILETVAKTAGMAGQELAAFMAQCEHETMGCVLMYELWDGKGQQAKYDGDPTLAAKLGNTSPGDGHKYRGRGFLQITGKYNYEFYGKKTNLDLVDNPDLAAETNNAARIAVQYWNTRTVKGKTLSEQAKAGEFKLVTLGINGGYTGQHEREMLYNKYLTKYGNGAGTQEPAKITPSASGAATKQNPNTSAGKINYPVNVGKSIVDIISDVVRNSSYIRDQITDPKYKETPVDPKELLKNKGENAALNWFKIVPEITLKEWDTGRNQFAKHITYYITPHTIYNTAIPTAPKGKPSGAVKRYFYIYTGQNRDIINFNLDFDSTYFIAHTAMTENSSKTEQTVKQEVASATDAARSQAAVTSLNELMKAEPSLEPKAIFVAPNPASLESRSLDPTTKITSDLLRNILSGPAQLLKVDLKIIGDPDFIKQDDIFYGPLYLSNLKESNLPLYQSQRTENGSLIMDLGQIHVELYFQTPSDYDKNGIAIPNGRYITSTFSGVYKILTIESEFNHGKFEQTLHLTRIMDQPAGALGNNAFRDLSDRENISNVNREMEKNNPSTVSISVSKPSTAPVPDIKNTVPTITSNGTPVVAANTLPLTVPPVTVAQAARTNSAAADFLAKNPGSSGLALVPSGTTAANRPARGREANDFPTVPIGRDN